MRLVVKRTISFDEAKKVMLEDFETTRKHPGFIFNYEITGMTAENKGDLIALHQWMNEYWREHIWNR